MIQKYHKLYKEEYEKWRAENPSIRERAAADPRRLQFHLMPESGWLNDPNGLCQFHGVYHIYYQFTPFEPTGELKLWGHYTTTDFIHYQSEEPVLFPDSDLDAHGAYSGSAFVQEDMIHFFYTGNLKLFDRDDYDYILTGRGSNTIHCTSTDGFSLSPKEKLLGNADYPSDMSAHIRDPKVLQANGRYYMVLGARDKESRGMILLYESDDLHHWSYYDRVTTRKPFGYMWECPDLFVLDGQMLLLCCPQGVDAQGDDFQNVHQCTVMRVNYDFAAHSYTIDEVPDIRMVDRGFDFYAPQTFLDECGRRILIGWMGIPDADYSNPTVEMGWQHALTIPRELHWTNGRLIQKPLPELAGLRTGTAVLPFDSSHQAVRETLVYEAEIAFQDCQSLRLVLRQDVVLLFDNGVLTLDLGSSGCGRTRRRVSVQELRALHIFSDTSSLEIFVNQGEEVFTTRVYSSHGQFAVGGVCAGEVRFHTLQGFTISAP